MNPYAELSVINHKEISNFLIMQDLLKCSPLKQYLFFRCIFVWRIPHDMVVTMHARLSQQAMRQGKTLEDEVFTDSSNTDFYDTNVNNVDNDYR